MMHLSRLRALIAIAALALAAPAFAADRILSLVFHADNSMWLDDAYAMTELDARVSVRGSTQFTEGPGTNVVAISGTRNGVPIVGLWKPDDGQFFGGWTPAQGLLDPRRAPNRQVVPYDGLAYVTADGVQHVLYGSTFSVGKKLSTTYYEMNQWASLSPYMPWVSFSGPVVRVSRAASAE